MSTPHVFTRDATTVARVTATRWKTPDTLGVAYLYLRRGETERRWVEPDYAVLDAQVRGWIAAAVARRC